MRLIRLSPIKKRKYVLDGKGDLSEIAKQKMID